GGTGKTSLALQVAADLQGAFAGGAAFVPLGAVADPALVASAVAQALGLERSSGRPAAERLPEALASRSLLLVLDNFEHVLPAAGLVAEILDAAPGLRVLVTSRSPLHLAAEHE